MHFPNPLTPVVCMCVCLYAAGMTRDERERIFYPQKNRDELKPYKIQSSQNLGY